MPRHPLTAVLAAGSLAATIDIVYACSFHYFHNAVAPLRILQTIASGVLGTAAFDGGAAAGALGLVLHYFILIVAAAIWWIASRRWRFLVDRAFVAGVAFGVGIWLTMNFVVLPLSAAPPFRLSWSVGSVSNALVHFLVLGPVVALTLRRALRAPVPDEMR
ncbi:MAG TPA: hypothetical protein VJ724_06110 [Tahibacter sp.]|nr:hypothetical protein [Tahibacter sp.]